MAGELAVVGAGLMGSGIAQVAAQAGWRVTLRDIGDDVLGRAMAGLRSSLDRSVQRGRLTVEDADSAFGRIRPTTDLDEATGADVVIEAVFEDPEVKRELFATLDRIVSADALLATNTSAIPITLIAAATAHPERVVGTHFFSPVPAMRLCELVRGQLTSDETLARARAFAEGIGKTCVVVNRDVAGFVTTRLIVALAVEAARLVESGVASVEDVDTACKLGFGHAMGPFETMDLTGVDIMVHAARTVYADTADPKFHPPETLARMVAAGQLGRKTGRGWYDHRAGG